MIKKPNIVNIRMEIHNNCGKSQQILSQQLKGMKKDYKQQQILKNINELFKIVTEQRIRRRQNQHKIDKTNTINNIKFNKQKNIIVSIDILQSIETILKQYLSFKIEQNNQIFAQNQLKPKSSVHVETYKKNKEKSQDYHFTSQQKEEENIFTEHQKLKSKNEKLQQKVVELQKQLINLGQKLNEKNSIIEQLLSKEKQLKNKLNNEVSRLIRSEKLWQIHQKHEKKMMKNDKDYLINIVGKNIKQNINHTNSATHLVKSNKNTYKDREEEPVVQFTINQKDCNHNSIKVGTFFVKNINIDNKNQKQKDLKKNNHNKSLRNTIKMYQKQFNAKQKLSNDKQNLILIEPFRNLLKPYNLTSDSEAFKKYQMKQQTLFQRKASFTLQKRSNNNDIRMKMTKKMNTEEDRLSKDQIQILGNNTHDDIQFV